MYTKVNSFDSINSVPDIRGLNRRVAKKDKEIAIQARISGLVMKCMSSVGSKVDDGTVSWNVIIRDIFGVDGVGFEFEGQVRFGRVAKPRLWES
jgi:hypothetical protein